MALRLIEVVAPAEPAGRIPEILKDHDLLGIWTSELEDGGRVTRVLLRSDQTEAATDALDQALQGEQGFRMLLFAVEATVPTPEEPEAGERDESDESSEDVAPARISREELYEDISSSARLSRVYLATVALSALVAAVGLVRGDVVLIIGAMVIAPLLGPNVALSLASTLGDPALAGRSLKAIAAGIAVAAGIALGLGLLLPVDPGVPELAARARVGYEDVAVATAAGAAGTLAYTTGIPAAIVGVMVAVALLPPLVATGLLAGAGHLTLAVAALTLVVTNVVCLNLAGVVTFLIQKVRPRTWWEAEKAKKATRLAVSSWALMLAVLAVIIYLLDAGRP